MRTSWCLLGVILVSAAVAFGATKDSRTPSNAAPAAAPQLGKLLFANVTTVHFSGPSFPANSDGTFGGLTVRNDLAATINIYEKYIVRDEFGEDGIGRRTVYAYDKLGTLEQLLKQ